MVIYWRRQQDDTPPASYNQKGDDNYVQMSYEAPAPVAQTSMPMTSMGGTNPGPGSSASHAPVLNTVRMQEYSDRELDKKEQLSDRYKVVDPSADPAASTRAGIGTGSDLHTLHKPLHPSGN